MKPESPSTLLAVSQSAFSCFKVHTAYTRQQLCQKLVSMQRQRQKITLARVANGFVEVM